MNKNGKTKIKKVLASEKPSKVKSRIAKTEIIQMRVSKSDKDSMKKTAQNCGLTLSEYLIRCHEVILEKLKNVIKK